jgi:hypothetical protein
MVDGLLMCAYELSHPSHRDLAQADILDGGPDNRQATVLGREDINLIGALSYIAEETFNGVGGLNMPVHALGKGIKGQEVLFVLHQASYRFGIALAIFRFEGSQLDDCLLFCRLLPDSREFSLDLVALSSGDGVQDIALFMHKTALTRGGRKQSLHGSQQETIPIVVYQESSARR